MSQHVKFAAIQMSPGSDKAANLATAAHWIEQAAGDGAEIVALQEIFYFRGSPADEVHIQERIPGPTTEFLGQLAHKHQVYLVAGSLLETTPHSSKAWNTSVVFAPTGEILARYRKIHLFEIQSEHDTVSESNTREAGHEVVCVDTPWARLGLSICYDLRFPELYRQLTLQGAQILMVPAAFLMQTGKDHWEVLLRARAIENQCYVVAPNCLGRNAVTGTMTYGRSMIIDPWGNVVAQASDQPGYIMARLDMGLIAHVRLKVPTIANRRLSGFDSCTVFNG